MNKKLLYLCHGKAGYLGLQKLVTILDNPSDNILVYTYNDDSNFLTIKFCNDNKIRFKTNLLSDSKKVIEIFEPDLIVSIHYRNIIKNEILKLSKRGGINLHPSLLPKYRGCFSAPWALINMEKETGITYHFIDEGIDTGNIILQKKINILKQDTAFSLFNKCIDVGVDNLIDAVKLSIDEGFYGTPQSGISSYYKRELPFGGIIDNSWTFDKKEAFVRALHFPPHKGAIFVNNKGKNIEINNLDQLHRELKNNGNDC